MSFGRLGSLGRGFGRLGAGKGRATIIPGVITAQTGTYTITGMDAGLLYGRTPLAAAVGSYTITGIDAAFPRTYVLTADTGSIAVTGIDATLTYAAGGGTLGQTQGLLLSLTYAA